MRPTRKHFLQAAALAGVAPFVLGARKRRSLSRSLQRARARSVVVDQSNLPAPNILFVLTDDQPPHTVPAMEKTLARFTGEGVPGADLTANAYTAVPLCGPARCALLTGRYQHSTGLTGNDGAFLKYREGGYPKTDMLSRVKAAGYRLFFGGKYINGYEFNNRLAHPAFGPDDRWVALADGQGTSPYAVNIDGNLRSSEKNHTPYFGSHAEIFIRNSASETRPWMCYLNWTDPHIPHKSADITGSYSTPATEETDLSDKSDYTRDQPKYGPDYHREVHQGQGGEVERLDNWMELLFQALEETGQLENTVVLYSSDNGFLTGEHGGLTKKSMPYGEAAGTPMLVRGPGFGPHPDGSPLCSHVDLTATVCAVAGADTEGLEGRDLRDLWTGGPWRERLLVEMISPERELWAMLREGKWSYIDFAGDVRDKELYDLDADPHQLESLHAAPEHAEVMAGLAGRLETMRGASGEELRAAESP